MKLGTLDFTAVNETPELVAPVTWQTVQDHDLKDVYVTAIDATLADTAAFCEHYQIGLDVSANCVIIEAKRGDEVRYAACMILATDRIDVNGTVRKYLEARKASFAPMDTATSLTKMEYGGITPVGLPKEWALLVDSSVAKLPQAIIGSGLRKSKLLVSGELLAGLPGAVVMDLTKKA